MKFCLVQLEPRKRDYVEEEIKPKQSVAPAYRNWQFPTVVEVSECGNLSSPPSLAHTHYAQLEGVYATGDI